MPHESSSDLPALRITSAQNSRIKRAVKLRDRRWRDKLERIVIDGWREVARASSTGITIEEAFFSQADQLDSTQQALLKRLADHQCALIELDSRLHDKVAFGQRSGSLVAIAKPPACSLQGIHLPDCPLVAILEQVEKPGNFGAIVRTADAAGLSAVIAADPATDLFNPNAIRASQAAVFTVPVAAAEEPAVAEWAAEHVSHVLVARVDGSQDYRQVDFRRSTAIVLGSESKGASDAWPRAEFQAIRVPMLGAVDSLNVSATAAVLFYEALRQRQPWGPEGEKDRRPGNTP